MTQRPLPVELLAAMSHYQTANSAEDGLIDILTDLRHWCATFGLDFNKANRIACGHYAEESTDDR